MARYLHPAHANHDHFSNQRLHSASCATSVLRNFAAYAASLAGYTAAIIAYDQLGATGGPNGDAFMLAIFRVSEIWLGIVCAVAESPLGAELWPDIAILFESSRGCWWGAKSHCTFCGLKASTMLFRSRSAVTVAREILDLAARYRVLNFAAVDDIIDLAHIRDLLPLLKESGCDLQIFYETKANLNKDQIRAFHDAGVTEIQPGIESLSTPILRLMRKGVTALNNIRLLKWCAEIGVEPQWNLLYGFPDEPPEEYDRMADLIPSLVHLDPPLFRPIQIQRFSPYFERAADFGIEIVGPMPYYRFLYPVPPPSLSNLVYDFQHRYRDGRDPSSYTQRLKEATDRWRESAASGLKSLSYRRGPGFLIVNDRRPGLEEADYEFEDVEAKIYLACDAGATVERIRSLLLVEDDGAPETDEIQEFFDDLVSARLMYREGNSYLSLAIAETGDTAGGSRPAELRTSAESGLPTVAA